VAEGNKEAPPEDRAKAKGSSEKGETVAEVPEGYKEVPPEDRAKATGFFEKGKTVAGTGQYEYAIEMYLQGFALDPDDIEAHQELRDFSLKRKASGGKAIGFLEAMKLKRPTSDDRTNMLNAEKLMSYDPGNTDHMQSLLQSAYRGGYYDTVLWIGAIFQKANADDKKPDFSKFIVLRDVMKGLKQWRLAADACQYALKLHPLDMDLATELKNLGAMDTMESAGYAKGGSFRDQIRDMNKQSLLLTGDKDYADLDAQQAVIHQAEADYKAEPHDPSKAMKLVDALEKTEHPDFESKAIDILQDWYDKTKQFRYRQRIGFIQMKQLARMERSKREALTLDPKNEDLRKEYTDSRREQIEFELKEYQLASDAYPTDMRWKFEMGRRMFSLTNFVGAIPVLQQARNDPKFRVDAGILLGLAFFNANYLDEADDTLGGLIKDYQLRGDDRSKEMYYWRGRVLEQKGMTPEALAHYSQVTQWDFNFKDVQARVRKLKPATPPGGGPPK
jgi:tetratricopeptide (TPR) repeat protein